MGSLFRRLRRKRVRADSIQEGGTIYGRPVDRREFTYCDDGRIALLVTYEDGRVEAFRPWSLVRR